MVPSSPTHDEFANILMGRLARAGEEATLVYDDRRFCLLMNRAGDSAGALDISGLQQLAQWYERFTQARNDSQREAILDQFVDFWFATKQQARSGRAADTSRMLPLVRSRFNHEMTKLQLAVSNPKQAAEIESQLAYHVFAGHLAVTIGEEFQHSYRQLTRHDLEQFGLSFAEALAAAKANLSRRDANFAGGPRFELVEDMLWCPAGELSNNNSAALLYADEIRRLPVRGQHVAVVPHSQIVWITGSANIKALRWLSELTLQEVREHPAPISALPFILDNDQWRPWLPATTHPAHAAMKMLHVHDASAVYDEQAELLRQKHLAQNVDLHLAEYRPMEVTKDDGQLEYYSVCVWTDSVATLLPKTDLIALQRLENREALERGATDTPEFGEVLCVPWERFEAHLGTRLRRQELYPERYLVDATLAESSWAVLAGEQHHFAAALLDGLAESKPAAATQSQSRLGWWIAGSMVGCASVFVTLFVVAIVGALMLMPRNERQFMPRNEAPFVPVPPRQELVELPPFAELDRPGLPLPELTWQRDGLVASSLGGSERPPVYKDVAPPGGWLVGLRLTKGKNWGGAIRAIQPIYQVGDAYHLGDRHGLPGGVSQTQLLARPGYAVGAVTVRAGLVMNAMQVEFHRVKEDGLDGGDAYQSEWVGCDGGHPHDPLRSDGPPIVGITGSYIEDHFGIRVYRAIPSPPVGQPLPLIEGGTRR